jgi:predicted enzyme related to lactoylglutathione lyase
MAKPSSPQLLAAAPVLAVVDAMKSMEYYRDQLGFRVAFTDGEPVYYAIVERDDVRIHLMTADAAKRTAGQGSVYVFAHDVDDLHTEFTGRGARVVGPPRDYPYGMRDFNVRDLDGNDLCFGMESKPAKAE